MNWIILFFFQKLQLQVQQPETSRPDSIKPILVLVPTFNYLKKELFFIFDMNWQ